MSSSFSFLLTGNYRQASVTEDGEFDDFTAEDPVLAVTASFPESNVFGRTFRALLFSKLCLLTK